MKFEDLLSQYGIAYETEGSHTRQGWIQFHCPFCGGGSDPSKPYMGYNTYGHYCNCWVCGHHSVLETLVALTRENYTTCKKLLDSLEVISPSKIISKRGKLKLPKGLGPLQRPHKNYLKKRGFNPKEIQKLWCVKGIGLNSTRFKWRIFIPIFLEGNIVSWTTRSISDSVNKRYVAAAEDEEIFNAKELLYGEDFVRHTVIVCEGPLDVWKIGPGAVALLGTGFKPAQVLKIAKYPRRVICLDNEPTAQKVAKDLCNQLSIMPGETYNVVLDSNDPGSATKEEIKQLRKRFLEDD